MLYSTGSVVAVLRTLFVRWLCPVRIPRQTARHFLSGIKFSTVQRAMTNYKIYYRQVITDSPKKLGVTATPIRTCFSDHHHAWFVTIWKEFFVRSFSICFTVCWLLCASLSISICLTVSLSHCLTLFVLLCIISLCTVFLSWLYVSFCISFCMCIFL